MLYYEKLGFNEEIIALAARAEEDIKKYFEEIEERAAINTAKVLAVFQKHRVADQMFSMTSGYGYDDLGRDTLDKIYADIFHTEAALVRPGFVNGTHAITCALFSALKPGDVLASVTGIPYDTLQSAIGISGSYPGSLRYYGIGYEQVELLENGEPDIEAIKEIAKRKDVTAITVQRSRGYSTRDSLSVETIGKICDAVHSVSPNTAVIVDNCYGEFVETLEPTDVGADLIAGSLIKNPGGGLAPTGGYIAGRADLIEAAAMHLTAPGIGAECGCSVSGNRLFYQGLFLAPHTVAQAVKTAVFCARLMELMGYSASPDHKAKRADIIQTVSFGDPEMLKKFCQGIQFGSPVDSYVTPEPWDMPGYEDQVIMAAGTFVQGSSIELSCDGPMREPYIAYLQGGITYEAGKLGIMSAASKMMENK